QLLGTVTDGDIRRGFLNGLTINDSAAQVMNKTPLVAPAAMPKHNRVNFMRLNKIRHLPLVDNNDKLVSMEWQPAGGNGNGETLTAVVMAGGEGLRLRPLTENMPKPMIKVGGKPILLTILEQLKKAGFRKIIINVRYLGHIIEDYFKDGSAFDLDISYIHEPEPLGTAGSLALIPEEKKPATAFLVVNGDLMSTLNFKFFRDFHVAGNYTFTLCGRVYEVKIPFGYPQIEGDLVTAFKEKPTFRHLVNSGIYCLAPEVIDYVPKNAYLDMPDLIRKVIDDKKRVGAFPLREKFHEIGRVESLKKAEIFYKENFSQYNQPKVKN
ncbi:MAG: NTP transferase domain-containing protein, partial [bacterium]|nr:NTP transferase domain-containing protein [bacterium]